jgi:hypothetical protein
MSGLGQKLTLLMAGSFVSFVPSADFDGMLIPLASRAVSGFPSPHFSETSDPL